MYAPWFTAGESHVVQEDRSGEITIRAASFWKFSIDLASRREIGGRVEPGPRQDEIGVVIGHALAPPEVDRTHFTFVVERPELNGADALHIPGMEELVRADGLRAAWVTRQRLRGHPDSRGIQMLEAAAATADKDVGVVPIWCAAENE